MSGIRYVSVCESWKNPIPYIWMYNDEGVLREDLANCYLVKIRDVIITSSNEETAKRTEYWEAQNGFREKREKSGRTFAINLGKVVR